MSIFLDFVVPFLLLMSALVAVHELGHFLAARMLGIGVTDFSLGMGPLVCSIRDRWGCHWQVRALPIGGYVKMVGDGDASSSPAAADKVADGDRARAFHLRPVSHRAWVTVAGPLANFLLGIAIIAGIYVANGRMYTPPVVSEVVAGAPAQVAGMLPGDRILAIGGRTVERFEDVVGEIGGNPGREVRIQVRRDGEVLTLSVVPESVRMESVFGTHHSAGRIGIAAAGRVTERLGPFGATLYAVKDVYVITIATLDALWDVMVGMRPVDDLGGPVEIAEMSGHAAKVGWLPLVFLAAIISVNLGIMNLMPIPVLDGGHLALYAVEAVRGRPANPRVMVWAYRAGAGALLLLLAVVTFNDVWSLLERNGVLPAREPASGGLAAGKRRYLVLEGELAALDVGNPDIVRHRPRHLVV